jgi:predicted NAD/FAD-binding protein
MTLEEWIGKLPVSTGFKNNILFPWIAALIGNSVAAARNSSARSILQTFALAFPANIFAGASTYNSRLGLEGNLHRMLDRAPSAQVHVDSAVTGLAYADGKWTVNTAAASFGGFDAVVMNAPPHASKGLLQPLSWAGDIAANLDKFSYFDARIVIHTDAKYVHRDRHFWAAYNGMIDNGECEGSVWYGGIHEKLASGGTLDIFKSWAQRRSADPAHIIEERRYKHPLINKQTVQAARALRGFQGRNGLYFSGQQTTGFDLQEAAVYSAMKVADALAPASATLASLKARLKTRGRDAISYDL